MEKNNNKPDWEKQFDEEFPVGDLLYCKRSWSAWGVGTMTENDFEDIGEEVKDFIHKERQRLINNQIDNLETLLEFEDHEKESIIKYRISKLKELK